MQWLPGYKFIHIIITAYNQQINKHIFDFDKHTRWSEREWVKYHTFTKCSWDFWENPGISPRNPSVSLKFQSLLNKSIQLYLCIGE